MALTMSYRRPTSSQCRQQGECCGCEVYVNDSTSLLQFHREECGEVNLKSEKLINDHANVVYVYILHVNSRIANWLT